MIGCVANAARVAAARVGSIASGWLVHGSVVRALDTRDGAG
jgi:hypothetical protein